MKLRGKTVQEIMRQCESTVLKGSDALENDSPIKRAVDAGKVSEFLDDVLGPVLREMTISEGEKVASFAELYAKSGQWARGRVERSLAQLVRTIGSRVRDREVDVDQVVRLVPVLLKAQGNAEK